jgi:exonuclease III
MRRINGKINELMISILSDEPSIICLSEHHLNVQEMDVTDIPKYKFGSGYCRKKFKNGGVSIFVQEDQNFTSLNLQKYCKEHDIEIAAIKAELNEEKIIVLCIYRSPLGDYDFFLNKLDCVLNSLLKYNSEFIICGDININYLENNNRKSKLDILLNTYNLIDTVQFPIRIANNPATLIDNIFIHNRRSYSIKPCTRINGLSDHDAQRMSLKSIIVSNNVLDLFLFEISIRIILRN